MGKYVRRVKVSNKTPLCYSKKLITGTDIVTAILTATTFICALFPDYINVNIDVLKDMTETAWTASAVGHAVYFWKSKAENKIKISKKMIEELADKYGFDSVVNLLGLIFTE